MASRTLRKSIHQYDRDSLSIMTLNTSSSSKANKLKKRHRIAMVCDFFHPRLGGVENHIYSLAQHLIRQGHKVIVITHAYHNHTSTTAGKRQEKEDFNGVRYFPGPLKVYYCPLIPIVDQDTLPTFLASLPLMRWILIREGIEIVHAHQATSTMANECIVYASLLNLKRVYTDHSLFSLNDLAGVILNRVLQITLSTTLHAAICVSHVCRDNFILRTKINPNRVVVIPNAVDATKFMPPNQQELQQQMQQVNNSREKCHETTQADHRIKIVVISRLVYRKGVDLLVGIIPLICHAHDHVDFIIGGDGTKLLALQEMLERERLQDRVELLGFVAHVNVRNVLIRGHVFLNCSLTESFCIAILEAASAGLLVVATNVGGVPEVLPDDMIFLAHPNIPDMVDAVGRAIQQQTKVQQQQQQRMVPSNDDSNGSTDEESKNINPWQAHKRVKEMYSWQRVADETIALYDRITCISNDEEENEENNNNNGNCLLQRLDHYYSSLGGGFSGLVVCFLAVTLQLWLHVVEWLQPLATIEVVPDLPIDAQVVPPSTASLLLQHQQQQQHQHEDKNNVNYNDDPCSSKMDQAEEILN